MEHSLFLILLSGSVSDSSLTPSLPTALHTNPTTELSQEQKIKVETTQCTWELRALGCPALDSQESSRGKGLGRRWGGELAR